MAANRKRTYQYEFLDNGFTQLEDNGMMKPQCVVCMKILTLESLKKTQLKKYSDNLHSTCLPNRENTLQIYKYLLKDKD